MERAGNDQRAGAGLPDTGGFFKTDDRVSAESDLPVSGALYRRRKRREYFRGKGGEGVPGEGSESPLPAS